MEKIKKIIPYIPNIILCLIYFITDNLLFIFVSIIFSTIVYFKNKNFKSYMTSLFITYIFAIINLTLFSATYRRIFSLFDWTPEAFKEYLKTCNIIPFYTIIYFFSYLFNFSDQITVTDAIVNLVGNTICLIPLAIFIPYFFKNTTSIKIFSIFIILTTLGIEITQFITMTGAFDIDDLFLNSLGAILFYSLFKDEINRFIVNNFKLINNKKELKTFILKIIVLLIIIILPTIFFINRKQAESKHWNEYYFESLELLNYPDICQSRKETFIYEDKIFKYYIDCDSPNQIELKINQTTVNLMNYLNNKTMYPVILHKLKDSGLKITGQEKYKKILISSNSPINFYNSDTEIIETTNTGASLALPEFSSSEGYEYYIIPYREGNAYTKFEYDGHEVIYHFTVDKDKNYTYYIENIK